MIAKKLDTVFIRGLEIDTVIGCYEHEKTKPQRVTIDLEMAWDIRRAGANDLLEDTLNYDAVRQRIEKLCEEEHFALVEALVERIANVLMTDFKIPGLRLRLAKPEAIENTIDVGVVIARGTEF